MRGQEMEEIISAMKRWQLKAAFKRWCESSPTRLPIVLCGFPFCPGHFDQIKIANRSYSSYNLSLLHLPLFHYHCLTSILLPFFIPIMRGWVQAICFHSSRAVPLVTSRGIAFLCMQLVTGVVMLSLSFSLSPLASI